MFSESLLWGSAGLMPAPWSASFLGRGQSCGGVVEGAIEREQLSECQATFAWDIDVPGVLIIARSA